MAETVTVAAGLSVLTPEPSVIRTQKEVVALIAGVMKAAAVAPANGFAVTPDAPWYH